MFTFNTIYSAFTDSQILSNLYIVIKPFCFDLPKNLETHHFLFSYLLIRHIVDPEVNFSKDILTYFYSLLTHNMPIFTWMLIPHLQVQWREVPRSFRSCVLGGEGLPETAAH